MIKLIPNSKFGYTTYPLFTIEKEMQEVETPNGKQMVEVEVKKPLPNIIEVDEAVLDEIGKTKCFSADLKSVIDYTPPAPPKPSYEAVVEEKIRARYSVSDELGILRQRDTKPSEFAEYNAYCEQCKADAKKEVQR